MNANVRPATCGRSGNAALLKSRHLAGRRTTARIYVGNSGASAFYLQLHDLTDTEATTALAATTAVPAYPAIKVLPDTTVIIPDGFSFTKGALIAASSTRDTLTLIAGNDAAIVVEA